MSGRTRVLAALTVVAILAAAVLIMARPATYEVTAHFERATGIYAGDDVMAIGVGIGSIESITPGPRDVTVVMKLDRDVKLAAGAKASIVSPALVAVRHIEIGPLWESGSDLGDGDVIPLARTAVPIEWDQLKSQLVRFSQALGPEGANRDGSLSRALDVSADNLAGQGLSVGRTMDELSRAMQLLADNKGDLFATVRHLDTFTDALVDSDALVRNFTDDLAEIAETLDSQRGEFRSMLRTTSDAFGDVTRLLKENKSALKSTTEGVADMAALVGRDRYDLADLLQLLPTTLSNLYNIYDPIVPAYTGSLAAAQFSSPATFLCSTVFSLGGTPQQCQELLAPLAKFLTMDPPPIGIAPIQRNGYGSGTEKAAPSAGSVAGQPVTPSGLAEQLTTLLGGLL